MNQHYEIFRLILFIFGIIEILTNGFYLVHKNGLIFARKQHGELPPDISIHKLRIKVICVFITGVAFFLVTGLSFLLNITLMIPLLIVMVAFVLYGLTEALYYRYWKTFGFATLTIVILITYLFT